MNISRWILTSYLLFILIVFACQRKQDGVCEGNVVPAGTPARITAIRDEKDVLTVYAGAQDGKFKLALAAGVYTINVVAPESHYPLRLDNIVVKAGETTVLPPIALTSQSGTGVLTGTIKPPHPDAEVKLIYEGKERAAVRTDREGKYEFKELPAGSYIIRQCAGTRE